MKIKDVKIVGKSDVVIDPNSFEPLVKFQVEFIARYEAQQDTSRPSNEMGDEQCQALGQDIYDEIKSEGCATKRSEGVKRIPF